MSGILVGRINTAPDMDVEKAIQEVATEVGNNFQFGSDVPDGGSAGRVYFRIGATDANGWAEVSNIYIKIDS